MEETVKVICVTCPRGCTLEALKNGNTVLEVTGGGCKRGKEYVKGELTDPRRMVATTVKIQGAIHPLVPVSTSKPFPKKQIPDLIRLLRIVEVKSPVKVGEVVLKDVLASGIDVLVSRSM